MSDILAARINERMMDWVKLINESRICLVKTAQSAFMLMLLMSGLFTEKEVPRKKYLNSRYFRKTQHWWGSLCGWEFANSCLERLNSQSSWQIDCMAEAEFVWWHRKDFLLFVFVEFILLFSSSWVRWKDQRHQWGAVPCMSDLQPSRQVPASAHH